jgi:predicted ABC-type ATPase
MNPDQPLLLAFAGPNGAGKSTLRSHTTAATSVPVVNADDIAVWLFGEQAAGHIYEAAEIAEAIRGILSNRRRSFSFETVLSDPAGEKVRFLREARDAGYWVVVHFVGIGSPAQSRARVIQRVNEGGHDVPDDKIAARYPRVMENLARLLDVPDDLVIYDNSSHDAPYRVIARLARGVLREITANLPPWAHFLDLPSHQTANTTILP